MFVCSIEAIIAKHHLKMKDFMILVVYYYSGLNGNLVTLHLIFNVFFSSIIWPCVGNQCVQE